MNITQFRIMEQVIRQMDRGELERFALASAAAAGQVVGSLGAVGVLVEYPAEIGKDRASEVADAAAEFARRCVEMEASLN